MAESARLASSQLGPRSGSLYIRLATVLSDIAGEEITGSSFDASQLTDHLRITFSIENDDGSPIAIGKDLDALRMLVSAQLREAIAEAGPEHRAIGHRRLGLR